MLKRLEVRGVKSLAEVAVDLERLTVLVGPNGCGKSTLLDQLQWACRQSANLQNLTNEASIRAIFAPEPTTATRRGYEAARRWLLQLADGTRACWDEAQLAVRNGWIAQISGRHEGAEWSCGRNWEGWAGLESAPADPSASLQLRAQRLRLSPDAISAPSAVDITSLQANGAGLPTVLRDVVLEDHERLVAIQEDLRRVVPSFRAVKFGKGVLGNKPQTTPATTLELEMAGAGRVPAHMVSDGTLVALALLTALHGPQMPRILLMDDIDQGLHLSAQIEVIEAIRRVMEQHPELQVICSSHSPIILDSFRPEEVRVMALDAEGCTRLRPLKEHTQFDRWASALRTGELWANLGEDWVCAS